MVARLFTAAVMLLFLAGCTAAPAAELAPSPAATLLASAALEAFPGWSGSTGEALVEELPGGGRVIELSLTISGEVSGYREVWLITSDASELVSLGVVDGISGTFIVPEGLDLSRYDLVDVSSEPYDGNPAHSGDSIVRGKLS
ncbi:MAG: anti-sigma factor domain-containing protein [Rhodoglobus sp.]